MIKRYPFISNPNNPTLLRLMVLSYVEAVVDYPDENPGRYRSFLLRNYKRRMERALIVVDAKLAAKTPLRARMRAIHSQYRGKRR